MTEGHFIVLEGIDGAGTTTHARLLGEALTEAGQAVHVTHQPSSGPVGALLRQMLQGRVVVPGIQGSRAPSWATMALLFAADRADHLEAEIVPNLRDGITVICDRYYHSSLAYQSLSSGSDAETLGWIRQINLLARRPDLTLVLDVSPEEAARRCRKRSPARELYEEAELQRQLAEFYRTLEAHFEDERIVHVDGEGSVARIGAEIRERVERLSEPAR